MATILFKTDKGREFPLEFNTERHTSGAFFELYAGGHDSRTMTSVYEADKGYIILGILPQIDKFGESGYSTSLTGRDSNVEKVEKIHEVLDVLIEKSGKKEDQSTSDMLKWVNKYFMDYYLKITSTNARFEVYTYAKSREIKIGPIVINTITAKIKGSFTFHVMKLITPEELQLLSSFFDDAIEENATITKEFK